MTLNVSVAIGNTVILVSRAVHSGAQVHLCVARISNIRGAPYDKTTLGDTQQSKDRFITEAYDEAGQLPPVTDGKRAMPVR